MSDGLRFDEALRAGDLETLKQLLGSGFPNRVPRELGGGSLLEYAIYKSPIPLIKTLIESGADPNYEEHGGFPSLIAALSSDRKDMHEILRLLLKAGADANVHGIEDNTPLHQAVWLDDPVALRMLIEHGASLKERRRIDDCETPLEEAERVRCQAAIQVLREAIETAELARRSFPLDPAALPYSVEELHQEIGNAFGSRPYPGHGGIAVRQDSVWRFFRGKSWQEITMESVAKETEVDWVSFPFSMKREGFDYYLPAFLTLALDVSGPVDIGDPLLFFLGVFGEQLIRRLDPAEKRAVVHVLEYLSAEYKRRGYAVNLAGRALDDYWADKTAEELRGGLNLARIDTAFKEGNLDILRAVFGPEFPNCRVPDLLYSCLEYAIRRGPLSLIRSMLSLGAELDKASSINAAMVNAQGEKHEIIKFLISLDADVNGRGADGMTPLHWAAILNDAVAVQILVAHGADSAARTRNDDNATPLELAEKHGAQDAAEALKTSRP